MGRFLDVATKIGGKNVRVVNGDSRVSSMVGRFDSGGSPQKGM